MRWYLTHLLKVLHLCWFNKRNNKRVLFVDDCDTNFTKRFNITVYQGQLAFVTRKNKYKGFQALPKKQFLFLK
jgi:peroxiredoxin